MLGGLAEAGGTNRGDAGVRSGRRLPARTARAAPGAGVVAESHDVHVDVAGARLDRDPLPGPGVAPAREGTGDHGALEEAAPRKRVAHGSRAVVAVVDEGPVAAASDVREVGDLVAGADHAIHRLRS